ncbi:hypothetical protein [Nocardioides sp.]|uniref:hypothetical protein n=1 Tax=Nocardioides sp. TaxID=35761 RepID=UPI0027342217|nr:hypothetical protein [Nocardioides sp.]MDP3892153.1 hypothetical protein [Nocardioides sp.]
MGRAVRITVVGLAALGVVAAVGVAIHTGLGPLPARQGCTATVGDHTVEVSTEQAENASLIAAIGVRRGLPARAVSIALATAYQESKILNIDYGDRDSLGIFQQRPSQGWGSVEQVQDPVYSTNAFYDALERVKGYEDMRITEAAQRVQRSGFPEAYEQHADDARALASALTGFSPGGRFTCVVRHDADAGSTELDDQGLTERAAAVRADLRRAFGDVPMGGFAPGGVSNGHMEGSAHYEGRAVDVFVRPVNEANNRRGWAIAAYLVANAARLEIQHVIFDARIWSEGRRSEQGWRTYDPDTSGRSPDAVEILEHRDHVHVDVP